MTEISLRITAWAGAAKASARMRAAPCIVPGTLPGEDVTAAGEGERLALVAVTAPRPSASQPFCKHYGRCGGCQLQHWQEEPYRAWKASLVADALQARGLPSACRIASTRMARAAAG